VRLVLVAFVLVVGAVHGAAGERDGGSSLDLIIPIVPEEHERLHYFDRRDHHLVPGTVTINKAPYVCDPDGKRFRDRDEFVAHLRTVHRTPPGAIADRIVVRDGVVHFIGE
jgi:hypothetical protein